MKKYVSRSGYLMLVAGLFFAISCNPPSTTIGVVSRNGPPNLGFVKESMIEKGTRLKAKFPDDEFYGLDNEILVEFYQEGEEDGSKGLFVYPNSLIKLINAGKKEKDEENSDKSLMSTKIKARVTYYNTVLSLKDWHRFSDGIPYTQGEKVENVMASYNTEMNEWFIPTVFDRSIEDGSIFYSDARMKFFSIDAFTVGTQISYSYTVTYDNINYLANMFFHEYYPMNKRSVTFVIPEWLDMNLVEKNFHGFDVQKTEVKPKKSKISELRDFLNNFDGDDGTAKKKSRKKSKSKASKDQYTYVTYEINNLTNSGGEKLASGPTYNLPHLLLNTRKYTGRDGKENRVMTDINDLYGWYSSLVSKVDNDSAFIRKKALEITEGKKTDQEKIEAIFYWVQDNIRYIAFEDGIAGFKPDACQKVLNNRYGDCKGMANLTAQMLKSLGYDARLTWIGTRHIAYNYSVPSIAIDNHMICTLFLNGKRYFLDPTESFIAFGDYAHRIQGRQVLIEDGKNYILDSIPELSYERNKNETVNKLVLNGKNLVGTGSKVYRGESKTFLLYAFNAIKSDRKSNFTERFLTDEDVNIKISNIKNNEISERTKNIEFNYDLKVLNHVIVNGNQTFINAEWEHDWRYLDLDSSRLRDVEFNSKIFITKETRITIPATAKVKYIPAPVSIDHKYFKIQLSYKRVGNELVYTKSIIFPEGKLPKSCHQDWNAARKSLEAFYVDYVILTN